jgi:hypothetical protein
MEGVGIVLDFYPHVRHPVVVSLMLGKAADRCKRIGIGDKLIAVAGQTTQGKTFYEVRDLIIGPVGSTVTLNFQGIASEYKCDLVRGYDKLDALAIEGACQPRCVAPVQMRSGWYSVSLAKSKQENLATGFEHEVRRVDIKGTVMSTPLPLAPASSPAAMLEEAAAAPKFLPAHWDTNAKMDPVAVVPVPTGSTEFTFVQAEFSKTAQGCTIVGVERIQNKTLWNRYCICRETMNERAPPSARAREMRLFHGTKADSMDKINVQGLNRAFAGQNATSLGKGVYFARDASYSAQDTYSPKGAEGEKQMYLALVAVGDYCKGNKDEPVPSKARPGATSVHDLCDSTVDNEASPTIFVTYNDTQQYPDYRITFKKS